MEDRMDQPNQPVEGTTPEMPPMPDYTTPAVPPKKKMSGWLIALIVVLVICCCVVVVFALGSSLFMGPIKDALNDLNYQYLVPVSQFLM